jgi:asparagine synthase (glutamine-hydrolysing)
MSSLILDIPISNQMNSEQSFFLDYCTSSKFQNDKIHFENENFYILLDGFVLNKSKLFQNNDSYSWAEFIIDLYQKHGDSFFKMLKGSYYGFLWDKKQNKWILFTDHISSKPLFFSKYKNRIVFANQYTDLLDYLKKMGEIVTLNEYSAYLLLTYGYTFEDNTITNEIHRMMVGHYMTIEDENVSSFKFFTISNNPVDISEDKAIEMIDYHFQNAIRMAFEKDNEYGYQHVANLSGGLDSRMTVMVAHAMGYTHQLNLTFSQNNYLDETIAKQIAADLKHDWIFKSLDHGEFLKNIDETTKITGGNVLYYGLSHGLSLYNYINFSHLGIMHSGQIGDVIISTFYSSLNKDKSFSLGDGAYSLRFLDRIKTTQFKEEYQNEEIFKLYIRGFYGANQGLQAIIKETETYSPFYDIDLMEFCLSIPLKLRYNHNIYKKWINAKYPDAARYIWEKIKVPINYPFMIPVKGKLIPMNQILPLILKKTGLKKQSLESKNHMNPLEYWYHTNESLREFMDDYFDKNIALLDVFPQLKEDCISLWNRSKGTEKNQILSLLSAAKLIQK